MRVATWNIHRGRGTAGWFRPGRVLQVIGELGADLIGLQEAQHYLRRETPMLDEARLAAMGLRSIRLPETPRQQGWRSNVLLARQGALLLRPPEGLPLGGMEPRGALVAELDLGGGPVRVIVAHLSLGAGRRVRQGERLLAALRREPALPTLLLADMNEWRPGASALGVLAPALGAPPHPPSFPAFWPRLPLDRILPHPPVPGWRVAVHDTPLSRRASDHLPLVAEWRPDGGPEAA